MKGYVRMILVVTLLLLSTALLAALNLTGLWGAEQYSWQVSGKLGPGVITKSGGDLYFLSKDGTMYELKTSGQKIALGQADGIKNVVAPAAYTTTKDSTDCIVYVTAQNDGNKIVVHNLFQKAGKTSSLPASAYGVVVHPVPDKTASLTIYTGTMDKKVYKITFDASKMEFEASKTVNVNAPIKVPPVLNQVKDKLYVLTQYGSLYEIGTGSFTGTVTPRLGLGGEFTVPMAMDGSGNLYALNTAGTIYKINTSSFAEEHANFSIGCDSAGILIDGDGYVYAFGGGTIIAINPSGLLKLGEYSTKQRITTTPAIVKGEDGVTYIIVPSSQGDNTGKITILSFDPIAGSFTKVWEMVTASSFPISAAVGVAPMLSTLNNNYYFATATNDGTVYAWQINARGPYGTWAVYGQNAKHTGFIDVSSTLFRTRIFIKAIEPFSGKELSSAVIGNSTYYGILYDATVMNSDKSSPALKKNLRTNEANLSYIPEGIPGQLLEVKFSTPTTATLLFKPTFTEKKGGIGIDKDATFTFAKWDDKYDGVQGTGILSNLATMTYGFNDKTEKLYPDASYTYYLYHYYPGDTNQSATTVDATFKYSDYESFKAGTTPVPSITLNASTTHSNQKWYAYKWNIWQWDPTKSGNYINYTLNDRDKVSLPLQGPAYVEIYYAQLGATITLLVPDFAYGRTPAYIFLDAAQNAISYTIEATTLNGVTIEKIVSEEYASGLSKMEGTTSSNYLKYVFQSMEQPLTEATRVATLSVNLSFPEKAKLNVDNLAQFFDLYGYAQIRGQFVDPQNLRAKKVFAVNSYLYVIGDFDDDFDVDIKDWNFFASKYNTTVSGADVIYNIGPREDFVPPAPTLNYKAGFLIDTTNKVDSLDLNYFTSMFGFAVQEVDRVRVQ
ncbi:MAG TPA: hypothetical protein PLD16_07750 [Fervidobacterium sp.]|nr:hypothetical protein [Fervidobacterium sp.]